LYNKKLVLTLSKCHLFIIENRTLGNITQDYFHYSNGVVSSSSVNVALGGGRSSFWRLVGVEDPDSTNSTVTSELLTSLGDLDIVEPLKLFLIPIISQNFSVCGFGYGMTSRGTLISNCQAKRGLLE
jgi:hypothetical protein